MKLLRAGSQLSTSSTKYLQLKHVTFVCFADLSNTGTWPMVSVYLSSHFFQKFFDKAKAKKCVSVLIYDNYPTKYFLVV